MVWIALVLAALVTLALAFIARGRRRPMRAEVQSMRTTLERRVREGADFRF